MLSNVRFLIALIPGVLATAVSGAVLLGDGFRLLGGAMTPPAHAVLAEMTSLAQVPAVQVATVVDAASRAEAQAARCLDDLSPVTRGLLALQGARRDLQARCRYRESVAEELTDWLSRRADDGMSLAALDEQSRLRLGADASLIATLARAQEARVGGGFQLLLLAMACVQAASLAALTLAARGLAGRRRSEGDGLPATSLRPSPASAVPLLPPAELIVSLPDRVALRSWLEHRMWTHTTCASRAGARGQGNALLLVRMELLAPDMSALSEAQLAEVYAQAAKRVTHSTRDEDCAVMLPGGEFAVLLEAIAHTDEIKTVGTRIIDSLSQPFRAEVDEWRFAVYVGTAQHPAQALTAAELIANAELAMHHARHRGHGSTCPFADVDQLLRAS